MRYLLKPEEEQLHYGNILILTDSSATALLLTGRGRMRLVQLYFVKPKCFFNESLIKERCEMEVED